MDFFFCDKHINSHKSQNPPHASPQSQGISGIKCETIQLLWLQFKQILNILLKKQ